MVRRGDAELPVTGKRARERKREREKEGERGSRIDIDGRGESRRSALSLMSGRESSTDYGLTVQSSL